MRCVFSRCMALPWVLAALAGCPAAGPAGGDDDGPAPGVEHVYGEAAAEALTDALDFPGLDYEFVWDWPPAPSEGDAVALSGESGGTVLLEPGGGGTLSLGYRVPEPGPIDVIIWMDGADFYIVIHLDLSGEEPTGTIEIPFEVHDQVCDALYSIQHAIQCNETIVDAGGNVADYLVQELALLCEAGGAVGGDGDDDDDDDVADDDDDIADDDDDDGGFAELWNYTGYDLIDVWAYEVEGVGDSYVCEYMADGDGCSTGWLPTGIWAFEAPLVDDSTCWAAIPLTKICCGESYYFEFDEENIGCE